ncbi:MAG: TadE/TadG family type IV pilus assembly protein, partial [Actinomycetota bacterium]
MRLTEIRARLQRQDGVAAVEFAIVAMVFLVLLFGILTFGFIFGLDQSMNHAAEE